MDNVNLLQADVLFNMEDSLKYILTTCQNEGQENQIREKLCKVQKQLGYIYIN